MTSSKHGRKVGFGFVHGYPIEIRDLDPPLRPGQPWRRRYRLHVRHGFRGPHRTIASDDAPMSDAETTKLWIEINLALLVLVLVFAGWLLVSWLT